MADKKYDVLLSDLSAQEKTKAIADEEGISVKEARVKLKTLRIQYGAELKADRLKKTVKAEDKAEADLKKAKAEKKAEAKPKG